MVFRNLLLVLVAPNPSWYLGIPKRLAWVVQFWSGYSKCPASCWQVPCDHYRYSGYPSIPQSFLFIICWMNIAVNKVAFGYIMADARVIIMNVTIGDYVPIYNAKKTPRWQRCHTGITRVQNRRTSFSYTKRGCSTNIFSYAAGKQRALRRQA